MNQISVRGEVSTEQLRDGCERFVAWLDREGPASYDPYDIWGTPYGLWSRRMYYRHGLLGAALITPLVALDTLAPSARSLFVRKERYATSDAQLLLAFLNLHAITRNEEYLARATRFGDELLTYSIPGYSGPCWGYPFDWQNGKGPPWTRNTPYITCTPYCYEAFLGLHEATGNARFLETARGIAEFVLRDLKEIPTSPTASAGSYGPFDERKVVNASAYRAFVLIDAGLRFQRADCREAGLRNLAFVLESQRPDGSWLYAMEGTKSFIDNFHTCFNLKNLEKLNRLLARVDVRAAIQRGFDYYEANLFHGNGDPKSFAIEPRFQVTRLEMYNFAEGMTLGALLAPGIPGALPLAQRLARRLLSDFQLPDGHFVTRVFRDGRQHCFPFIRWPQAQLFLGLTNLLRALAREDREWN